VAALNGPQELVRERGQAFQGRRDLVVGMLNQASGIDCANPEGAFYVFPSCEGALGRRKPDGSHLHNEMDFCEYLLKDHGVAVVPGAVFGSPGHFRISYAYAETALEEACRRIQTACGALRD
jgi:aspartate aminotransferase